MPAQGGFVSSSQQQSPDLAVVGGGVIGLAVAWRAALRGLRTVVLERARIGAGASGVAAGMLAPSTEASFGEGPLPRPTLPGLAGALVAAGAALREGAEVAALESRAGRVTGVRLVDGESISAGAVVIAAGAWSGGLDGLPDDARVPLRPVKGQLMRLSDPAGPGLLERVLRTEDFYVVPRGDGAYVLGATMEERGFDDTVTAGGLHDLLRDAIELVPGMTELALEEACAGLRPSTPDNAPAIGSGALERLHWAVGHHRHGVLLAPLTADLLADELTGSPPRADAAFVSPARFDAGIRAEVPA